MKEKDWLTVEKHDCSVMSFTMAALYNGGKRLGVTFPSTVLSFGADSEIELFVQSGFTGVRVFGPQEQLPKPNLSWKHLRALVHQDPKIIPVFGGYFIRPVTVKEIFDQFPGPYSVISVNVESMSRMIWESDQIQDHLPYVYVLPEDGHNEGVMHRAWDRGYSRHHVRDRLVLVKDFVMEA